MGEFLTKLLKLDNILACAILAIVIALGLLIGTVLADASVVLAEYITNG